MQTERDSSAWKRSTSPWLAKEWSQPSQTTPMQALQTHEAQCSIQPSQATCSFLNLSSLCLSLRSSGMGSICLFNRPSSPLLGLKCIESFLHALAVLGRSQANE